MPSNKDKSSDQKDSQNTQNNGPNDNGQEGNAGETGGENPNTGNPGDSTGTQGGGSSLKENASDAIDMTTKAAEAYNKLKATVTLEKVTADYASVNEAAASWEKVSFDKIIAEPLKATVKAQGDAAKSVLEFIRNVGVTSDSDNGSETLTVVSFNFFKNGKNSKLQIPLITLVPIPALCIDEVTYDFKMTISSSSDVTMTNTNSITSKFDVNDTPEQQTGGGAQAKKGDEKGKEAKEKDATSEADASKVKEATKKAVSFTAGYSSKKDSTATQTSKYSVETTMDVKLKVGKDDLPAGVSKMLEILNGSTEIYDPNGELTLSADNLTLTNGYAILSVVYKDGNGNFDVSAIKCTDMDNKEKGQKSESADNLQIVFTDPGVYKVSAGKKCQLVQINPSVSTAES